MTNQIFLHYINKNQENQKFHFDSSIPFLWQECYDLNFLEQQESQFSNLSDSEKLKFLISVETAIQNLKLKSQSFTHETDRKKKLRSELIAFFENQVEQNSNLELNLTALLDFYSDSKKIFFDLKDFHLNKRKQLKIQKEKLSFRSIGYNNDFADYSVNYQFLIEEAEVHKKINDSRHQTIVERRNNPKNFNKKADQLFWLVFSILTFSTGILFILFKVEFKYSLSLMLITLLSGIYWYLKFGKSN